MYIHLRSIINDFKRFWGTYIHVYPGGRGRGTEKYKNMFQNGSIRNNLRLSLHAELLKCLPYIFTGLLDIINQ